MVLLLQWNARSLSDHGQVLKEDVDDLSSKPDVICAQETLGKSAPGICDVLSLRSNHMRVFIPVTLAKYLRSSHHFQGTARDVTTKHLRRPDNGV